jgi:hypothetical protein
MIRQQRNVLLFIAISIFMERGAKKRNRQAPWLNGKWGFSLS